ncbi:MAG: hypothetical protein N2578_02235 [Bdellovibrionaceae bacterium]|nr:hypothetical protein [Pseudobdellovibrionaceae bacterium]
MKTWVIAVMVTLVSLRSIAMTIDQAKGNKVRIDLEGETVSVGDEFFALNLVGKKAAILRIEKVGKDKAIAVIVKGNADVGYTLQPRPSRSSKNTITPKENPQVFYAPISNAFGITAAFQSHSMNITPAGAGSPVSMSGSTLALEAFYDHSLDEAFVFKVQGGLSPFKASGSSSTITCSGSSTCEFSVNYLSLFGLLKYRLNTGNYSFWVQGGIGLLFPMGKSSNAISTEKISMNQMFLFAGGVDLRTGPNNFVPISLEYGLLPSTASVSAYSTILRSGYGFSF